MKKSAANHKLAKAKIEKLKKSRLNKATERVHQTIANGEIFSVYRPSDNITVGHAWFLYVKDLELIAREYLNL